MRLLILPTLEPGKTLDSCGYSAGVTVRPKMRRKSLRSLAASQVILVGLEEGDAARLRGEEGAGRRGFAGLAARFGVVLADMAMNMVTMANQEGEDREDGDCCLLMRSFCL